VTEFRVGDSYIANVDYSNPNGIYFGEAVPGSLTSDQVWRIRMVTISGMSVTVLWANGTNSFDKIWDNRGQYSYE